MKFNLLMMFHSVGENVQRFILIESVNSIRSPIVEMISSKKIVEKSVMMD